MEALILKYIDGDATAEEKILVEQSVLEDAEFAKLYHAYLNMDLQLSRHAAAQPDEIFLDALAKHAASQVVANRNADIIPIRWLITLILFATGVIIIALRLSDGKSILPENLMPDPKLFTMLSWVTVSFLVLFIMDVMIKSLIRHKSENPLAG